MVLNNLFFNTDSMFSFNLLLVYNNHENSIVIFICNKYNSAKVSCLCLLIRLFIF